MNIQKLKSKKGASPWIAWILLIAFVVSLAAFMYSFMMSHTEERTEDMKEMVYNTDECRSVSLNIISACMSAQVLNITLY